MPHTATLPVSEAKKRLTKTCRFGSKISWKIKLNNELATAIDDYFFDSYEIELPITRDQYNQQRKAPFIFNPSGPSVQEQQEHYEKMQGFYEVYQELINLRYALRETRGYYAEFENERGIKKLVPMTFWYSRNRLDYVWNMRKSQIIRNRYYEFLKEAIDCDGNLLYQHFHPVHLTLTLPHQDGLFKGKRFYAKELIELFRSLREFKFWKEMIYAGEYGIEIKKSQKHGLHIHMHCLILQYPEYKINTVRDEITSAWKQLTGNTSNYSGLHYETLFTWERDENGKIRHENKKIKDESGKWITKEVPVKKYIEPGKSSLEDYLAGVMECIKYHFKPDCLEKEEGDYDIELIKDILDNTKGKRLYSRFGGFYRQESLNFNRIEKETEELTEDELEEEVIASSEGVEERMINPFTMQPARRSDYQIKVGKPEMLRYRPKDDPSAPYEPYYYGTAEILHSTPGELSLKDIIKIHAQRKIYPKIE